MFITNNHDLFQLCDTKILPNIKMSQNIMTRIVVVWEVSEYVSTIAQRTMERQLYIDTLYCMWHSKGKITAKLEFSHGLARIADGWKTLKPMMLSEAVGAPVSPLNVSTKIFKICKISSELLRRNPFSIDLKILTILAWKNLIQYKNSLKYKVGCFWRF